MRLWLRAAYVVAVLAPLLLCPVCAHAESRKIVLASSEYPPYFGQNLPNFGGISEIVVEAYRRVGYEVEIQFYPWIRALQMVKEGKCDGMFALWRTPEREQWLAFSDPLPANTLGFFKRKADTIVFTRMEDLKSYQIGTVRGYANPVAFEAATYLKRQEVSADVQNLRKLAAHRIDLALIDKALAYYLLRTALPEAQEQLVWLEPPVQVLPQHLVISKQAAEFQRKMDDFNNGLSRITRDGLVNAIRARHGF